MGKNLGKYWRGPFLHLSGPLVSARGIASESHRVYNDDLLRFITLQSTFATIRHGIHHLSARLSEHTFDALRVLTCAALPNAHIALRDSRGCFVLFLAVLVVRGHYGSQ